MDAKSQEAKTYPQLLLEKYHKYGDKRAAMRHKDYGRWKEYTWKDYYEHVKYICLGLVDLGMRPDDKVIIGGDTEPQGHWVILGVMSARATMVGFFPDALPSEIQYMADHSEARYAIVEDQEQADKFLKIKDNLPRLEKVIYWDPKGLSYYDDPILMSLDALMENGKKLDKSRPSYFEELVNEGKETDIALCLYTSGTRALPKAALLNYKAAISGAEVTATMVPLEDWYNTLSIMPLAWIAANILDYGPHLITGMTLNFVEEPETVFNDMREIAPHFVILSPREWEGIISQVRFKTGDAGLLKRFFFNLFLPVGYKRADSKGDLNIFWKILYNMGYLFVFRPLLDKVGMIKIAVAMSGGAPMGPDSFRFLNALGINVKQAYGLTEVNPTTGHQGNDIKYGSCGVPVTDTEVRISSELEILSRGNQKFQGYFKNPEATERAFSGDWFCTGDAGFIDEDGHLFYYDRVADMMQLSTGDRFAAPYIEGKLKFSPYIRDAMAIGRDFISLIVQINFDNVGRWAEKNHIAYTTFQDLSQKQEVRDLIAKEIIGVNKTLPDPVKVKKFFILHKEFDADEAELTRSKKLRREFMSDKYKDVIEDVYSGKDESYVKSVIVYQDGRKGETSTLIKINSPD